jgi:hypothetical protein
MQFVLVKLYSVCHGASSIEQEDDYFLQQTGFSLRKKLAKCYFWSIASCNAETWTLLKADQNYIKRFEMWWWRRNKKLSWTDRVRNEEVLHRVKRRGISYTQ